MFSHEETIPLFPTLLFIEDLPGEAAATLNPALAAATAPLLQGNRPQRQTQPDLMRRPEFADLAQRIAGAGEQAVAEYRYQHAGLALASLWATAAPGGMPEPLLTSPNAFLTALYVAEAPERLTLRCADPRAQAQILQVAVERPNALNARDTYLPLPPGRLILLPGWLPHALLPQAPGEQRLVFRATLQFGDFAQAISPPMWQGLTAAGER